MFKLIFVLAASLFFTEATAVYWPSKASRPHTACWEAQSPDSGLQILLSKVQGNESHTRVQIMDLNLENEQQIVLQDALMDVQAETDVYVGDEFRLEINRRTNEGTTQRSGTLELTVANRTPIKTEILCDALMHLMDKGLASF